MRSRPVVTLLALLLLGACEADPEPEPGGVDAAEDATAGEPLPDTFPVTGVADALPEGMPLPPPGERDPEPR